MWYIVGGLWWGTYGYQTENYGGEAEHDGREDDHVEHVASDPCVFKDEVEARV